MPMPITVQLKNSNIKEMKVLKVHIELKLQLRTRKYSKTCFLVKLRDIVSEVK